MIYVMSDIHGHQDAFDDILSQIQLSDHDHLYILGDVIDRGPDGIALLQRIRQMPRTTLLLGNHEYMMINRYKDSEDIDCGCHQTFRHGRLACLRLDDMHEYYAVEI